MAAKVIAEITSKPLLMNIIDISQDKENFENNVRERLAEESTEIKEHWGEDFGQATLITIYAIVILMAILWVWNLIALITNWDRLTVPVIILVILCLLGIIPLGPLLGLILIYATRSKEPLSKVEIVYVQKKSRRRKKVN